MPIQDTTIAAAEGGRFDAAIARPARTPAPGLVVVSSVFGVTPGLRASMERFAARGYLVLAPDIFWRVQPGPLAHDDAGRTAGIARMGTFDETLGLADLRACAETLKRDPACNGKVAFLGYCFGGLYAYYSLTRLGADAAVALHPTNIQEHLDEAPRVRAPFSLHLGDEDPWVPLDAIKSIKGALEGFADVMIYRYPAMKHGFAQVGSPAYDAAATELAENRAFAQLDAALQTPAGP